MDSIFFWSYILCFAFFFFARILTSIVFPVPTLKSPTQDQNKGKYAHISISNFFFSTRFKNKQQKNN